MLLLASALIVSSAFAQAQTQGPQAIVQIDPSSDAEGALLSPDAIGFEPSTAPVDASPAEAGSENPDPSTPPEPINDQPSASPVDNSGSDLDDPRPNVRSMVPSSPMSIATPTPKPTASTPAPSKTVSKAVPKAPSKVVKAVPKPAYVLSNSKPRTNASEILRSLVVKSTAYNSLHNQTDRTPTVTATGARTRFGVVALSRDLLRRIPYGSKILLEDLGTWANGRGRGRYNTMLSRTVFIVEDTMHPRKAGTVDVWFPARHQAIQWGARRLRIRVIQYGR